MGYEPLTSFRRPITRVETTPKPSRPTPDVSVNKWEALRELTVAREIYGLSDRDLSVLQALLSFHPETDLSLDAQAGLVVFPSNTSICERLHGMANSTMRRHLSRLIDAGLLIRRDSPNGKRYTRRTSVGRVAFGFDLRPLVQRHADHCAAAEDIRARQDRIKRLRETVSLMRRDLAALADWGQCDRPDLAIWDAYSDLARLTARDLRRKLDEQTLTSLHDQLMSALDRLRDILEPVENTETAADVSAGLGTSAAQSEQHHQNSDKDSYWSEGKDRSQIDEKDHTPALPLRMILACCPEIQSFSQDPIRHWHELVNISEMLRPMIGISSSAWEEARAAMGPEQTAVVLAAMFERLSTIRSPGGYLRHLARKSSDGRFSCAAMIMALRNAHGSQL
ncbi:replication initiation protein [Sagittula sp. NFXS13]|uniref:plasmid replication protein RepC n=1 Tax=Sagittula sp. NFXS13 TaxID=2819095 RepID=UPI0032DFD634